MLRSFLTAVSLMTGALVALPASATNTILVVETSSNVGGAGTDSNIYIRLFDGDGNSRRLRLQDLTGADDDILESGNFDVLTIENDGIDTAPVSIQVESDGSYPGSDWHLDRIHAVTYDPEDIQAMSMAGIAPSMLIAGALDESQMRDSRVFLSTFVHEDWITGEESEMIEGQMEKGVFMSREQPLVADGDGGNDGEVETKLYVVYETNALASATPVTRSMKSTISRNKTFSVFDSTSQEAKVGASITAGYAPPETGGGYAEATISAEFSYLTSEATEETWGSATTVETDDTVTAEPGTIQFRILETPGVVAQKTYKSLIQDKTFTGRYIKEASPFAPREVTLKARENGDGIWNRSLARAIAVAREKAGYDDLVQMLMKYEILANPMTYDQAMSN